MERRDFLAAPEFSFFFGTIRRNEGWIIASARGTRESVMTARRAVDFVASVFVSLARRASKNIPQTGALASRHAFDDRRRIYARRLCTIGA